MPWLLTARFMGLRFHAGPAALMSRVDIRRVSFLLGRGEAMMWLVLFACCIQPFAEPWHGRPLRTVSCRVASDRVASDRVASRDFRRRFPCFVLNVEFRMQRQQS